MSYPYTLGAIKGFPHNLQRKSETPCERKPPPSPSCSSVRRSERRRGRADTAQRESPLVESLSITRRSRPGPADRGSPGLCRPPLARGATPRSPAHLAGLNSTQRGGPSDLWHSSAFQKGWRFCVDFAGSLQHLREVKALPFSSPRYAWIRGNCITWYFSLRQQKLYLGHNKYRNINCLPRRVKHLNHFNIL